jgi:cell division protein FtsW
MKKLTQDSLVVLVLTFTLLSIGLIGIYSSSKVWAQYLYNDSYYYLKRQFIFILIGLILLFIAMKIKIKLLYRR